MATIAPEQYIFNIREAADFLGVSLRTLRDWRYKGKDPRSFSYADGKRAGVFYTRDSLIDFIRAHEESGGAGQ